jgi:hypothetical protein
MLKSGILHPQLNALPARCACDSQGLWEERERLHVFLASRTTVTTHDGGSSCFTKDFMLFIPTLPVIAETANLRPSQAILMVQSRNVSHTLGDRPETLMHSDGSPQISPRSSEITSTSQVTLARPIAPLSGRRRVYQASVAYALSHRAHMKVGAKSRGNQSKTTVSHDTHEIRASHFALEQP